MPSSRILIASNTLSSSAASVTFSSIPSTYTDLVLKWSVRDSNASLVANCFIYYNGNSSTTSYSQTYFRAGAGTIGNTQSSNISRIYLGYNNGANSTTNTFSGGELYIPNYALTSARPMGSFLAQENNSTDSGWIHNNAGLYRGTDAITSLTLDASVSFLTGSTFWLYGLKNS